jgi:hypothetical protein
MTRLLIGSMVLAILSLPSPVKAQEVSALEGVSDTVCVTDMKVMWLRPGCKVKVGYACCA